MVDRGLSYSLVPLPVAGLFASVVEGDAVMQDRDAVGVDPRRWRVYSRLLLRVMR
ncbi:hypothetical protein CLV47_12544 [Antricoccus suffuscus]|uniref:Uncharacterized protein n=1 Tax=Antricoccus suffuscus TaxID=1629062 RepID=A0A2T0ZB59_9ACTN|nr:hypothetical protein CLV47_12544 [Antricoccus suffuscus]